MICVNIAMNCDDLFKMTRRAIVRYEDETLYDGQINNKMVPDGIGTLYTHNGNFGGNWSNGRHTTSATRLGNPVNGHISCYTTTEYEEDYTQSTFGRLSGNFINGVIDGFGTFEDNNSIGETFYVEGRKCGREKSTIYLGDDMINYSYTYFTNDGREYITEWIIPHRGHHQLSQHGQYASHECDRYVEDVTKIDERVTKSDIILFCLHSQSRYIIGQKYDEYEARPLGLWRVVNGDGSVKFGYRGAPTLYNIDGTCISSEWSELDEKYFQYFNIGITNIFNIFNIGITNI